MRCNIAGCPGSYEPREVVRAVRHGERVIVIDHIPAEVCSACGDVLYAPETIERLERIRETATAPARTVPLFEFAESA